MTDDGKTQLMDQLSILRQEHRDLDTAISALEEKSPRNDLQLRRLKKKKLTLKDTISKIELELLPDIIA